MTQELLVILAFIVVGFIAVILFMRFYMNKVKDESALKIMVEWMKDIKIGTENSKQLTEQNIKDLNKTINERLDNAAKVISSLTRELGGVSQIGPDLRRLTETLSSPKLRGNFGEEILENLLSDVFPKELCRFQYRFKNGEVVDAVLDINDVLIPIDSKFSMENYRLFKEATPEKSDFFKRAFLKDVKKRVDEIHKKYILPQERTIDYALMFIPSEGVYIEVAADTDAQSYARSKKVVIVGPNTLNVTLRSILNSLRGQQISKAAQKVLAAINGIVQESDKFGRILETLGNHVKNTNNTMGTVSDGYGKLKSQIANTANLRLEDSPENMPVLAEGDKSNDF